MSDEIVKELKQIKQLLVVQAIKDKDFKEQVVFLKSLGFQSNEIGTILNKASSSVRVALHRAKKKSG